MQIGVGGIMSLVKEMHHLVSMFPNTSKCLQFLIRDPAAHDFFQAFGSLIKCNRLKISCDEVPPVWLFPFRNYKGPMFRHQSGFQEEFYSRVEVNHRVLGEAFKLIY